MMKSTRSMNGRKWRPRIKNITAVTAFSRNASLDNYDEDT